MLSFFPRGVLGEILNLIESVSEGFPSYSFNSTSRYLDDLLNIDNNFFDSMVNRIYPSKLQLYKTNVSDAMASFLDLHLSILSRLIFMINEIIWILILGIFHFKMVKFLFRHPMVFKFLSLFDLLECLVMMILILVITF